MVPTSTFWQVARVWYQGRMDLGFAPRTPDAAQALLTEAGLTQDFWRLA